jgi:YHS domain-containing protein
VPDRKASANYTGQFGIITGDAPEPGIRSARGSAGAVKDKRMNQRIIISIFLTVLLIIGIGARIVAQSVNTDRDGIAVKGYDVVAYFTLGEPTEGSPEFSVEYEGATYYFVNSRHRELFLEDPERYVPQYGGYCAYAVSYGGTASIKPDLWTIYEGPSVSELQ